MPIVHDPATGRFTSTTTAGGARLKVGVKKKLSETKGAVKYRGAKIEVTKTAGGGFTLATTVPKRTLANGVKVGGGTHIISGGPGAMSFQPKTLAQGLQKMRMRINTETAPMRNGGRQEELWEQRKRAGVKNPTNSWF